MREPVIAIQQGEVPFARLMQNIVEDWLIGEHLQLLGTPIRSDLLDK